MKKVLIIGGIVLLAGVLAWLLISKTNDDQTVENSEPQDFPARFDESEPTATLTPYESKFGGLAFEYPGNWNITEGANNSKDEQLFTVESPLDANEFYFCVDLHAQKGEPGQFVISEAEIVSAKPMESGRYSVIYKVDGLEGLQWGVTEEAPEVGGETFTSEITNQSGDRMQMYGRFNCRETDKPDVSTEEFQESRWFHEAEGIINSLEF